MSATSPNRPQALFVISSATTLPLSRPEGHPGISTGFFLVELAQMLAEFEDTHDFVLATPDGRAPQLDINGMGLSFHAVPHLATAAARTAIAQRGRDFDPRRFRAKYPQLVARRDAELDLARRHLGRIPVSEVLPNTEREVAILRDELAASFGALPEITYRSISDLLAADSDPDNAFSLRNLDFVHMPGGHAPMVDFRENPAMGELLNRLHEHLVPISLICHAPVALTSVRYRVIDGETVINENHPFRGAPITTFSTRGENVVLAVGYPRVPGEKTRLTYYVDQALEDAGYDVKTPLGPAGIKTVWHPQLRLLTGNGPQAIDKQAAHLRNVVA